MEKAWNWFGKYITILFIAFILMDFIGCSCYIRTFRYTPQVYRAPVILDLSLSGDQPIGAVGIDIYRW